MDARRFHANEGWLEEHLRAPEPFRTNRNDLPIGELTALLNGGVCLGGIQLLVVIEGRVRKLFLDVPDNFSLGGRGEGVAPLGEDLHQVVGKVSPSKVQSDNSVRERKPITRVEHNTFRKILGTVTLLALLVENV
jgi:hypothetical protein